MNVQRMAPTLLASFLLTAAGAHAQGSGEKATESRPVRDFKRIVLRLPLDVTVHRGKDFALTLTTDPSLLPLITTTVSGDELLISSTRSLGWVRGKNAADITLPDLRALQVRGSGDVKISGFQDSVDRELAVEGSGDIHFAGNAAKLGVTINGSGDVTLDSGSAQHLDVAINGSGDLAANALAAQSASISVNGSGDVSANLAGGNLSASINGSGGITWRGTAKSISVASHGSGSVHHEGS